MRQRKNKVEVHSLPNRPTVLEMECTASRSTVQGAVLRCGLVHDRYLTLALQGLEPTYNCETEKGVTTLIEPFNYNGIYI